mmetsp:Transcript_24012/g.56678  ORF Transcript_24012/g.56678 Transcript_24012/m.56678 type:complete len:1351 (-) Transcript_24012:265-4317(-)|eukprot:CAMPEP_0197174648 /NCGR_PEP_ID=MMETSP1423-20130617/1071_1 /TAXON_ID=476441 /ORGANISM="Pseudo-nitzschia heimii, Strain UNC1101" /LENGTH=1350 /DNA_ID=CAMNT_0042623591 /DNA_START=75 /DNA_END=4127 /DNA_ORIENTATION=+
MSDSVNTKAQPSNRGSSNSRGRGGRGGSRSGRGSSRAGRGRGRGKTRGNGGRGNDHIVKSGGATDHANSKKNKRETILEDRNQNHQKESLPLEHSVGTSSSSNNIDSLNGRGGKGRNNRNNGGGRNNGKGRGNKGRGKKSRGCISRNQKKKNGAVGNRSRSTSPMPQCDDDNEESIANSHFVKNANGMSSNSQIGHPNQISCNETYIFDEKNVHNANQTTSSNYLPGIPIVATESQIATALSLPTPPRSLGGKDGVPIILSRKSLPISPTTVNADYDYDSEAQLLSERLAVSALEDSFPDDIEEEKKEISVAEDEPKHTVDSGKSAVPVKQPKASNKKKSKKKNKNSNNTPIQDEEITEVEVTTTDAIKAIPAQEVSITANTKVQIRRTESSSSMNKIGEDGPKKFDVRSSGKGSKKGRSKKKKGLSKDNAVNQKAAKAFNKSVRLCVERSDPDGVREILHDKDNHNFALDKTVLETVMKAYVMAAMFEEGLYCLRNCTLPGTLSTIQTERILTCLPQNLRNSSAYTAVDMINALCIATEFDNPTSRTYFLRIVRGISLEFLEEVMSARDRICSAPCERLVRSAVCVVAARLKRGKKPNEMVVHPGEQLGIFVPDSMENRGIQAGDAVSILPYAGPYPMSAESLDRNMIEATVTNTNPMVLRLQDKMNASLYAMLTENTDGNVYRIDKLANRMGFNRQLSSAVAIASPLGDGKTRDTRRPCRQLIKAITAMDENIDRVMNHSGRNIHGEMTSTAALCAEAVPWNMNDEKDDRNDDDASRMASNLALEKYRALEGLNASQSLAVQGAVTNRLTLVQGPPGTGKTAVAIRILQHWARLAKSDATNGENPSPILATSDSNIAVDNLVEGCAAVGLQVVRLGRPEAIRPELLRFCIDRPPSSYSSCGSKEQYTNNPAQAFKERMKALKKAQIVCCTCIGSGGDILDAMTFDRVLVDEATQATEPAVLVPLMRGCRQLVLVGDHCQLPPTVLSTRAEEEGHGVPLFSRMVACGVPPFMLDTQYRMHPCIAMFPSDLFYGGKLLNGVSAPERRPLAGFPWPREEFPVAFVPVKGIEMDDGVSKMNEAEAAAACDAVAALLSGGQCTPSDIAVVTPYAAQARLIRRMTRRLTQSTGQAYIEVSSVDGFQGREKQAVVFSAVRSNDYGAIGFAGDWRRVNVSFTRARRALIVIGNDQTLRRGDPDTWMPWLAWADAHGLNMDKPGVPRGRYDPEQLRRVRGGTTAAEMLKDVLERQQAQLKIAEKQLEKAEKNAAGHIIGKDDDDDVSGENSNGANCTALSLEEDLARLTNTDGNWDDSDGEVEYNMHHSTSQPTLSSADRADGSSSEGDSPVDVWDL